MPDRDNISRGLLVFLFVCFTAVWFGTLDYRKLIGPDEGRYAEIPREMVASGDWTTPRLNNLKYFEKPPLQYWATAAAFEVFGEHDWVPRLWPALTGYLSILLAGFAALRLFGGRSALLAMLVLGSAFWHNLIGHIATLDMGTSFFLQLALTGVLFANAQDTPENRRRPWMLVTWAALALAMLSKGLIGLVLPGATLVAYSLLTRDWKPWRRLELLRGLPLFLIIAVPWFVSVSLANPEFPRFFFWHEHVERFLTKVHRRYQPDWYFIPILLIGFLPWSLAVVQSWFANLFGRPGREDGSRIFHSFQPGNFQPRRLLALWSLVIFAFFSLSSSKLPSYILPIFPALAILAGDTLANISRRALLLHLLVATALAAAALALLPQAAHLNTVNAPADLVPRYMRWLTVAAALWLVAGIAALWQTLRHRPLGAVLTLAMGTFLSGNIALLGHDILGRSYSAYDLANEIRPLAKGDIPFYSVGMYEQTLPYYLDRFVTLVDFKDELAFGIGQEPDKWLPTQEDFIARWKQDREALAVMEPGTYEQLQGKLPMAVVARDHDRVIVRKPQ